MTTNDFFIPSKVFDLANTLEPFGYDRFVGERRHNKFIVWYAGKPILLCTAEDGWMINNTLQKYEFVKATPTDEALLYILWNHNNLTIQQAKTVLVARKLGGA